MNELLDVIYNITELFIYINEQQDNKEEEYLLILVIFIIITAVVMRIFK